MTANNEIKTAEIIAFPKQHMRPEVLSREMQEHDNKARTFFLQNQMLNLANYMREGFDSFGVNTETERFACDFTYLMHIAHAIMSRQLELEHPMHDLLNAGERHELAEGVVQWSFPEHSPPKRRLKPKKKENALGYNGDNSQNILVTTNIPSANV